MKLYRILVILPSTPLLGGMLRVGSLHPVRVSAHCSALTHFILFNFTERRHGRLQGAGNITLKQTRTHLTNYKQSPTIIIIIITLHSTDCPGQNI